MTLQEQLTSLAGQLVCAFPNLQPKGRQMVCHSLCLLFACLDSKGTALRSVASGVVFPGLVQTLLSVSDDASEVTLTRTTPPTTPTHAHLLVAHSGLSSL